MSKITQDGLTRYGTCLISVHNTHMATVQWASKGERQNYSRAAEMNDNLLLDPVDLFRHFDVFDLSLVVLSLLHCPLSSDLGLASQLLFELGRLSSHLYRFNTVLFTPLFVLSLSLSHPAVHAAPHWY